MSVSKFSEIDEYGFKRSEEFDYRYFEEFMSVYYTVLTNRSIKWEKYMKKHKFDQQNNNVLKRYIRKGIPSPLRGEVWMRTSGAYQTQQKLSGLYQNLLNNTQYEEEIVDAIKIDLPRTFPDNIYFDNIKLQLFNILVSYAHHNKDIGYCQGLNYIAGLILIVTKNEEWTFWLLKELVERIVPSYHTKTMSGLITDIDVLDELIKLKVPDVHKHIKDLGLPWAVIASKWFICIFAEVLPIETVLRVWDCLFSEGYKILFRVCLTLVVRHRDEILQSEDMAGVATVLRDMVQSKKVMDCHDFIKSIFIIPGPSFKRSQIDRLRKSVNEKRQK